MSIQPKLDAIEPSSEAAWERRMSSAAVRDATGRDWDAWFALLDAAGAQGMPHAQIADYLRNGGFLTQPAWWCQMIAVGYEQRIGRREPGQNCNGEHNATVSRTLTGTLDDVLARWQATVDGAQEFDGVALVSEPASSVTPKWRYWRASLADGSKINVNISAKGEGRALLQIEHRNVGSSEVAAAWKTFWKAHLRAFDSPA